MKCRLSQVESREIVHRWLSFQVAKAVQMASRMYCRVRSRVWKLWHVDDAVREGGDAHQREAP